MNEMALIGFVWNAISGDVIGTAAYDGVKAILGKGFDRLASYCKGKQEERLQDCFAGSPLRVLICN